MAWTTVFISVMPWKSTRPIGAMERGAEALKLLRSKKLPDFIFY
jgi:hypothetical protein